MRILVLGSGGREHALVWKLRQSPKVQEVFVAPGNAGTAQIAQNIPLAIRDLDDLVMFAEERRIDLTVVGPDDALAAGVVDLFEAQGQRIFGPSKAGARLESSKSFAKTFMQRHGIPTAKYETFDDSASAIGSLDQFGFPVVIKADGLSLGKGVVIAQGRESAEETIRSMLDSGRFGVAGKKIVIEEYLQGTECSIHALVDGKDYLLFPTAQDHKQLYAGNKGPNTGGMGTFSPAHSVSPEILQEIERTVMRPFLRGLQEDNLNFRGLLFPGLMLTSGGPKVLEFNARFGDPETQVLLPRLRSDLIDLLEATVDQRLSQVLPKWSSEAVVCVVLASGGYPGRYETGKAIAGLENASAMPGVVLFHAGTRRDGDNFLTAGGRVLGVTARAETLAQANRRAYAAVEKIHFEGAYFRPDIAAAQI
jgi:phosphoribosylamine---glycine ligase